MITSTTELHRGPRFLASAGLVPLARTAASLRIPTCTRIGDFDFTSLTRYSQIIQLSTGDQMWRLLIVCNYNFIPYPLHILTMLYNTLPSHLICTDIGLFSKRDLKMKHFWPIHQSQAKL